MRFSLGIYLILTARLFLSPTQDADAILMKAASRGDLKKVRRLLGNGAQVNGRDSRGKTALHFAAQSKNVLVVDALVQAGADANAKADGDVTPLMLSVDMGFGDPEIALWLIRAGADVQAADTNGDTGVDNRHNRELP
jgi:ankyrin repeat protein